MFHEPLFHTETLILSMKRKKWTPEQEVTDEILALREKKKWQIALRRYVIDRHPSHNYAPYFGLDIHNFRKWISLQFKDEQSWSTFGKNWQLDHIIPVIYFDMGSSEDLSICWNFTNIRVADINTSENPGLRVDIIAAKAYFEEIFKSSSYSIIKKMLEKINILEDARVRQSTPMIDYINSNFEYLETLTKLDSYDYGKINQGDPLKEVLFEKESLKKLGK